MDIYSQKIERSELKKGDHIYTWRKQLYSHHGIFIGEGKVIHFVNTRREGGGGGSASLAPSTSSIGGSGGGKHKKKMACPKSYCKQENVIGSGVRLSCLDCFVEEGSLYRYKYQVSRVFLYAKLRGGTCTTAKSDPLEEVMHRVTYLHENGYGKYDLLNNNCEDFALYCKTGLWSTNIEYQGRSSQANMVRRTNQPTELEEHLQRIATAVPRSFSKREKNDLGIRKDVVKVPVEELSNFLVKLMQL